MPDAKSSDAFNQVAPEIRRYFSAKTLKPSFDFRDVWQDEHALAFTVAKSAGYDILGDVQAAVKKAIEERQEFKDFKDGLEPLLKRKGWWGRAMATDPLTGETKEVQLGSVRRLRTIYWANLRAARAAGEWEKIDRSKRVLPYLIYVISTAEHKRPLHLTWVGTVLPVDDPWWDTHYPPNGWGCMCRVRQISEIEAIRLGFDPEDYEAPDDGMVSYVNKRTGETMRVPAGVDPAWASNPGKTRVQNARDLIAGRLDTLDPETRRIAAADVAGSWMVERIRSGGISFDPKSLDPANVARGKIAAPIAALPEAIAKRAGTATLTLSVEDAQTIARLHPDLPVDWISKVQGAIEDGGLDGLAELGLGLAIADGRATLIAAPEASDETSP